MFCINTKFFKMVFYSCLLQVSLINAVWDQQSPLFRAGAKVAGSTVLGSVAGAGVVIGICIPGLIRACMCSKSVPNAVWCGTALLASWGMMGGSIVGVSTGLCWSYPEFKKIIKK